MYGVFPIATPQFGDAINQPGQVTKRYRRELNIPCETRECPFTFPPDIEIYSLQDALQFNEELSFLVNCPPGRVCPPGTWPRLVRFPRGSFTYPDPNTNPGFPINLFLQGCQSMVRVTLPADSTQAQINAAIQSILTEVARQQAECDAIERPPTPNPSPFWSNENVYSAVTCGECETPTYSGNLPWYIQIDHTTNELVLIAGVITGDSQAAANSQAQTILDNFKSTAITAGTLTCVACTISTASPLPDGEVGIAYSQALAVTGTFVATVWTIESGSLPDGLSLSSATGIISGTPTTEQTATFTVKATSGAQCCEKEFELEIAESDCADWSTLAWGIPDIASVPVASGTFTPQGASGDTFTIDLFCDNVNPAAVTVNWPGGQVPNLTYNGPGCNCNLHVEISGAATFGPDAQGVGFLILGDGAIFILNDNSQSYGYGTFDIPFSLPDTLGADMLIEVYILGNMFWGSEAGTLTITGTLSNV